MFKKIILSLLLFSLLISPMAIISAAENFEFEITLIKEKYEFILEIINLALAVIVAVFAIQVSALMKGGNMEKIWTFIFFGLFSLFFFQFAVFIKLDNPIAY